MPTAPGLHPSVRLEEFDVNERRTAYALSSCFYITNARSITLGSATYKYLIMRPAENIEHALPNAREVTFLFSPYDNFEARTLDAYFHIQQSFEDHRINGHFRLLCSKDNNIRLKMQKVCIDEPDIPVTIPFLYDQFLNGDARQIIIGAARESYHFRDLFAQRSPLQNDTYFFGRSAFLAGLRDRMGRAENSGVFGLRKSGKTSILLAAERSAKTDGHRFVFIDCQSPSVSTGNWNDVLRLIASQLRRAAGLSTTPVGLGDFSPSAAAESFEKTINDVYSRGKRLSVIAFDEIEHLSPNSGVERWRSGENSRFLWQTLRSIQQRTPGRLCFLIAGTNPQITEIRQIAGSDNPLLEYIHSQYLGGLSDAEIQLMCQSIGNLMGMDFDIESISDLYKSLGGHPYLTRQVCSFIHQRLSFEGRPTPVLYGDVHNALIKLDFSPLLDDVLSSLRERYPDEYECLRWIATGNIDQVQYFADRDPAFLRHLSGYGLIDVSGNTVRPRMELALEYLRRTASQSELIQQPEQRWAAAAARRGAVETRLRSAIRERSVDRFGKTDAADGIRRCLSRKRSEEVAAHSLDELFLASNSRLYWSDLLSIMESDREYWSLRLSAEFSEISRRMMTINDLRYDAHAKEFSNSDFDALLTNLAWLEEAL